ncbi:DUF2750 domain-containing protein [uncultured Aliiroseovarius sp.]|uniref:DUF2750 domain-containing protein n=1 Tax=uncultured Aliiroseovarius sp. TaxID=1658783 RepID=UPI00262850C8|nr:DUF2750 domain-containing protein [uncultured Aliiroseovarius sp.]
MAMKQSFRSAEERKIFMSMSDDERRNQRKPLTTAKIKGLKAATASDRARYLENEALGQEELWTAFEGGYLTGWEDRGVGRLVTPIWPHKEFVDCFAAFQSNDVTAVPIPITDWVDIVTPDLLDEHRLVALFPIDGEDVMLVEPVDLVNEWEESWKRYLKYQYKFGDKATHKAFGFDQE